MTAGLDIDVAAILTGESHLTEQDFEAVYLHYKPALARFAARQRASDPEGVANAALFDAYRAFGRLENRTEPAFRSYLYRAARSHVIAEHRRDDPVPVGIDDDDIVEESTVDELIEAQWLRGLIEELPPAQRAVVESRFFADLTAAATAAELNKSPNAVYQLQHRALRRLRATILAAATVIAILLALWGLSEGDGNARLVDRTPAERSVGPAPDVDDGRSEGVEADRSRMPVTEASQGRSSALTGRDVAGPGETSTTAAGPGNAAISDTTSIAGAAPPASGPTVTERSQPADATPDTTEHVQTTSTVGSTIATPAVTYAETCNGLPATIVGHGIIYGTDGPDVIVAGNGKDVIHGLGGDDTICGGNGKDELFGGAGDDVLVGGNGQDQLSGGVGNDVLVDQRGNERVIDDLTTD